jgi:hypothetical protein
MTTQSDLISLTPKERRDYGFARIRDAAFDAVSSLWARRQSEGMTQVDVANAIGGDPGWVSKNLRGPGNWTMKTFGTFVEALNGEALITVRAAEDPPPVRSNYHAYVSYEPEVTAISSSATVRPRGGEASSASGSPIRRGPVNTSIVIP